MQQFYYKVIFQHGSGHIILRVAYQHAKLQYQSKKQPPNRIHNIYFVNLLHGKQLIEQ